MRCTAFLFTMIMRFVCSPFPAIIGFVCLRHGDPHIGFGLGTYTWGRFFSQILRVLILASPLGLCCRGNMQETDHFERSPPFLAPS